MAVCSKKLVFLGVLAIISALLCTAGAIADDANPAVPWPHSQCKRLTVHRQAKSVLFHSVTVKIQLVTSVCYNGQVITYAGETCNVVRQDTFTVIVDQCSTSHYYYPVNEYPTSGYYSQANFNVHNCFFIRAGCWRSKNVTLGVYVNMVGQFVKDDGR